MRGSLLAVLTLILVREVLAVDVIIEPKHPVGQASLTAACLRDNPIHIRTNYTHAPARCHEVEGDWAGDFLQVAYTPKFFPADPPPPSHECINRTCYRCTPNQEQQETVLERNVLLPPIAPGDYFETFTPRPSLGTDKIGGADIEVAIAENYFLNDQWCGVGRGDGGAAPSLGEAVRFIVRIPDLGQTRRLIKDAGTDNQEALVGQTVTLRARVVRTVHGVSADEGLEGHAVVFTPKDPGGNTIGSPVSATSGADGYVTFALALNSGAGAYSVGAVCGGCPGGTTQNFTATAQQVQTILEKLPGAEGGDRQRQLKGSLLEPIRVRVRDTDGTLRPGVTINFSEASVPAPGSFSDPNPVTDEKGIATTVYRLGSTAGTYQLRAVCDVCAGTQGPTAQGLGPSSTQALQEVSLYEDARDLGEHPPFKGEDSPADEGHCAGEIIQITPGPDGQEPPQPNKRLLACANLQAGVTHLRCQPKKGDAGRFENFACSNWSVTPPGLVSLTIPEGQGADSNERNFASAYPLDFIVESQISSQLSGGRTCTASRTISVGSLELSRILDPDLVIFFPPLSGPGAMSASIVAEFKSDRTNVADLRDFIRITSPNSDLFASIQTSINNKYPDRVLITIQLKRLNSFPTRIPISIEVCGDLKSVNALVGPPWP